MNDYVNNAFSIKANNIDRFSSPASRPQAEAVLEGVVTFAENFQSRREWEGCAKWCDRAIRLAKDLSNSPASSSESAETPETVREESLAKAAKSMLASLFTLRGRYQCGAKLLQCCGVRPLQCTRWDNFGSCLIEDLLSHATTVR